MGRGRADARAPAPPHGLAPARQAIVLNVLAIASLFVLDEKGTLVNAPESQWRQSERFHQEARTKLRIESGRPRLESIQGRLASCLYLLHTRRPNQAWYIFGTTVQLAMALGLHRAAAQGLPQQRDYVALQTRRRTFWVLSTTDTYLSVILGRPPLLRLEDIDQDYPDAIDDEDFTGAGPLPDRPMGNKDSALHASILHAQIARIVKKATEEQYSVRPRTPRQQLDIAAGLNRAAADWQASLPLVLSGSIHPSSLVPILRRQLNVLQLAHAHALILINRPSLLLDTAAAAAAAASSSSVVENDHGEHSLIAMRDTQAGICLAAARAALDGIAAPDNGTSLLQTSWFTQYVAFNALSIVYVWLIQRRRNRLPGRGNGVGDEGLTAQQRDEEGDLFLLAEKVQRALIVVSQANAPSLRYNIVLEELQQETRRLMVCTGRGGAGPGAPAHAHPMSSTAQYQNGRMMSLAQEQQHQQHPAMMAEGGGQRTDMTDAVDAATMLQSMATMNPMPDFMDAEFPFDPDLWLHLDSFPFSDFGGPG